jgi:DNA-binding transcriptional ArsR family regulator
MATDATQWIMALNHPLRRRILRAIEPGDVASATELCQRFKLPRGNVAYHVKVLADLNVLKLMRTRKVRGAEELFYGVHFDGCGNWVQTALEDTRGSDGSSGRERST